MRLVTYIIVNIYLTVVFQFQISSTQKEAAEIQKLFSKCKIKTSDFDACIKRVFNKLRPYFKRGIPEMGVAPFDPHFAKEVKQMRSAFGMGYNLTLHDVFERGWSQSTVTKYKTDWENQRIIYSQYFPEKWLEGNYEFKGGALGLEVLRSGRWNLTLRDYSQTTRIKRNGSGLDVKVEIDHIGDMDIHVGNLLRGRSIMEYSITMLSAFYYKCRGITIPHSASIMFADAGVPDYYAVLDKIGGFWETVRNSSNKIIKVVAQQVLDRIINASWKPGFAVIRPLINDLVSTAFTDIWSKSFKDFPVQSFITE